MITVGDLENLTRIVSSLSEDDRAWLAVDNRGWGPLHQAAYNGHSHCVQYLGHTVAQDESYNK